MENNEAKKPQALYMILTGRKLGEIATALDVSVRSIQRWLEEPDFADAVREEHQAARRIAIAQARTEMASDLEEGQCSRSLLVQIRNDENAPIHARIRCAALLIGRADRWTREFDKEAVKEAAPLAQKVRQKMTNHDTAAETAQKPRQNTTENDMTARSDVPKCSILSHSVLCDSAPLREPAQKPRQKTTDHDTRTKTEQKITVPLPVFEPVQAIADSAESIVANLAERQAGAARHITTKSDTLRGAPPPKRCKTLHFRTGKRS